VDNLCVQRDGSVLLQDVSVHMHCGQLTALIGENGAGKTTFVHALLSQIAYSGQIRHLDEQGRMLSRILTGYVPQYLDFDREMPVSVLDFLAANMTRRPVWLGVGAKTRARCHAVLESVKAEHLVRTRLGALSGGELQRVLLALALTPEPDLMILDEPVSGIDANGLRMFLETVSSLHQKRHMAVLIISHDLALIQKYADHVVLLDRQILAQGTPGEVFASAAFSRVFGREAAG
jgi:zinc transport system ATP-binding protein